MVLQLVKLTCSNRRETRGTDSWIKYSKCTKIVIAFTSILFSQEEDKYSNGELVSTIRDSICCACVFVRHDPDGVSEES